jgi:signal transduction histidine kinase
MSAGTDSFSHASHGPDVLGLLLHSMSQPLTSLRCSLEMELERSLENSIDEAAERQQESVANALQQTETVIGMIQLMREYLDAEHPGPEIGCALWPVLSNVVEDFESMAAVREVELMIVGNCSAKLPMSEAQLRQALQYLVAAAIDEQSRGGRVTLRLEESAAETVLGIKGEGGNCGLDPGKPAVEGEGPRTEKEGFQPASISTLCKVRLAIAARVFEAAGESLGIGARPGDFVLRIPRRVNSLR